jgi:hypothetical protein
MLTCLFQSYYSYSTLGPNHQLTSVHVVEREDEDPSLMVGLLTVMVGLTALLIILAHKNNYFA